MNPQVQQQLQIDDKSDRSKKSCVYCRDDRGIYEGRKENYITI